MYILMNDHKITYHLAKVMDHKSDKYFALAASLREMQRTETYGELHHAKSKHANNKNPDCGNATGQMPQILQQINYKENKGMEKTP